MEHIRQYLIGVAASAIICGIAKCIADDKSLSSTMIRLIAGLILTITILSPVVELRLDALPELSFGFAADAKAAAAMGEEMASREFNAIIKEQLEAYTLDKAADFGAEIEVEFLMAEDSSVKPEGVIIRGGISPYAKTRLQQIIEEDLNIAKENQQWIG